MNEFEKWDKTNKINYATISGGRELCIKNERQNAWKAALEWVSTFTISESIKRELKSFSQQSNNQPNDSHD